LRLRERIADNKRKRKNMHYQEGRRMIKPVINFTLPATLKQKGKLWISSCPCIDVVSQGYTHEEAMENLKEAVQLFLVSCCERKVLDTALSQCGFKCATVQKPGRKQQGETVTVPLYMQADGRCTAECHA